MTEKIVELLKKKDNYISGEEISSKLKVTRQAIWKYIQELRELGYDIVAVPHLGYKLISSPDLLIPQEISTNLETNFIGKKIYYFESISSTMDLALKLGAEAEEEGAIVVAETQTKGRGRLGRHWISAKHKGIYFSLLLRPRIAPANVAILTLLIAVSAVEAIKESVGVEVNIKWPNDLLIGLKKIGGILTEINAETDLVHFIVIGLGLNVNNDDKSLVAHATSLKEYKKETINRVSLFQRMLSVIEDNYLHFQKEGFEFVIKKWLAYNATIGKRIKIESNLKHIEGEAVGIDSDGGLLVRSDSGLMQKVMAGDVTYCR